MPISRKLIYLAAASDDRSIPTVTSVRAPTPITPRPTNDPNRQRKNPRPPPKGDGQQKPPPHHIDEYA